MNKLIFILLLSFFYSNANADQLSDQMKTLESVQEKNDAAAQDYARVQADYARQQQEVKNAELKAAQLKADQREKQLAQERSEANRVAAANAKIAADKAEARVKAENEEREKDKERAQRQEDEEREFIKQQSELKIQQIELETQRLKAKADLEAAIAKDRIKTVEEETSLARKREATDIDVVQSEADATRSVSKGVGNYFSDIGSEGLYKFLTVLFLIILVLIIAAGIFYRHKLIRNPSTEVKPNKSEEESSEK